jgi:hypothetical protein
LNVAYVTISNNNTNRFGYIMRSTLHGPEAFLLKSKKPHVQALVARVHEMSVDEIDALSEKPDVKLGLKNIKKQGLQAESSAMAERLADMMIAKYHPELARHLDQ